MFSSSSSSAEEDLSQISSEILIKLLQLIFFQEFIVVKKILLLFLNEISRRKAQKNSYTHVSKTISFQIFIINNNTYSHLSCTEKFINGIHLHNEIILPHVLLPTSDTFLYKCTHVHMCVCVRSINEEKRLVKVCGGN